MFLKFKKYLIYVAGPYPFEVEDVTLGNVLFHKGQQKTSLFTGYTVQLCIFGKMKGGQVVLKDLV